jgi:hypothetical protein
MKVTCKTKPGFEMMEVTCLLLFLICPIYAQKRAEVLVTESELITVGKTPAILKETSGLYIDQTGNLWSHNDDRLPILYCFDTVGTVLKVIHLNHLNIGWEAISADSAGNIFIGAFGNNKNDRKDLAVIKLNPLHTLSARIEQGQLIRFHYADQRNFPPPAQNLQYDADALLVWHKSLYIFSKNRTTPHTGYTRVYKLPQQPGNQIASLTDSIFTGKGAIMDNWVTDAAISPDKKTLALLGHDKIWLITDFTYDNFSKGKITRLKLPHMTHKAGIAFANNTTVYIVDEKEFEILGGYIYKLKIDPFLTH